MPDSNFDWNLADFNTLALIIAIIKALDFLKEYPYLHITG